MYINRNITSNEKIKYIGFKIIFSFLGLAVFTVSSETEAVCLIVIPPLVKNVSIGEISVQPDTPVGTEIGSAYIAATNMATFRCEGPSSLSYTMTYMGGVESGILTNVYKTNLAGVGISVYNYSSSANMDFYYNAPPTIRNFNLAGWQEIVDSPGYIKLFKIGDITPGTLSASEIGRIISDGDGKAGYILNLSGGTVNARTCSVNTPSVNVIMGNYLATEFSGVGYTTTSRPVPITLKCDSGTRINANVTATADTNTSQQGAIQLSAGGAKGIAVQLLDKNDTGVKLNQKFLLDTTTTSGTYDFGWAARYLQTQPTVIPGDANAVVTVALTYE